MRISPRCEILLFYWVRDLEGRLGDDCGEFSISIEARPHSLTDRPTAADRGHRGRHAERLRRRGRHVRPRGHRHSAIQAAVAPTARVLAAARQAGMPVVYLKMGFSATLGRRGTRGAQPRSASRRAGGRPADHRAGWRREPGPDPRHLEHRHLAGAGSQPGDRVVDKHRFSGFFETELDAILREWADNLVFTGCTTSVCVESTLRDAFFRDYRCLVLADCTAEPIGHALERSNHDASLLLIQVMFGSVSDSTAFIEALEAAHMTVAAD